jgi:RimJ/RimL family protein N-acetyltransferase
MVEHAFAAAGHLLLLAGYRHGNEASRRILQGLGFVKTGDAMMFSKAVGAETPTARLELRREVWLGKGGPTK